MEPNDDSTRDPLVGEAIRSLPVPPEDRDILAAAREEIEASAGKRAAERSGRAQASRRWPFRIQPRSRARRPLVLAAVAIAVSLGCGVAIGATFGSGGSSSARASVLSFAPRDGWTTLTETWHLGGGRNPDQQVAYALNTHVSQTGNLDQGVLQTLRHLPPDGIVIFVTAVPRNDHQHVYTNRALPLQLSEARRSPSDGYEGQPAPNVSLYQLYAHVNGLYVIAYAWLGANKPSEEMLGIAQGELDRLVVPG